MRQHGYVIVSNPNGPVPLRHIIKIHEPYRKDAFTKWYYGQFAKLEGDEFTHCPTRMERDVLLDKLSTKGSCP